MKTFIIAEAGVNHNGSLELAKQLVEAAAQAQADAVKFQTFQAKELVSVHAPKAEYQKQTTDASESQLEMIRKLELSREDHLALIEHCRKHQILFLSSAFDLSSLDLLEELQMPIYKIPSGEITNLPMLRRIAKTQKPVILSTGMSDLKEISEAVDTLRNHGASDITLLHCNTQYPTPFADVHLKAMELLQETFQVPVGYSDHTVGIEVPLAAVALGAKVIEKHFTLDKTMEGPDHKASIDPQELRMMITMIRNIEVAIGIKQKQVTSSERQNREIARKSLVANRIIQAGEVFTPENVTQKRPGNGLHCKYYDDIIGTPAKHTYEIDELIHADELE